MFELLSHMVHMKAHLGHFTMLLPEEQHHEYVQEHDAGYCTQFRHCEDNPFYPDITQSDNNYDWYGTDQSGWLGWDDEDDVSPLDCYAAEMHACHEEATGKQKCTPRFGKRSCALLK